VCRRLTREAGEGIKPRVSPRTRGPNRVATLTREAGDGIKPRVSPRTRGPAGVATLTREAGEGLTQRSRSQELVSAWGFWCLPSAATRFAG